MNQDPFSKSVSDIFIILQHMGKKEGWGRQISKNLQKNPPNSKEYVIPSLKPLTPHQCPDQ